MNISLICRNVKHKFRNNLLQKIFLYSTYASNHSQVGFHNYYNINNVTSKSVVNISYINCKRYFSSDGEPPTKKITTLMDFPEIIWPSFFKSIRNFIFATLIIKPYFDREFTLSEFVRGSKQAVEVISSKIAEGDFQSLEGLVTSDTLSTLQKSISKMSLTQRDELSIKSEDIYFSFPYQVGVIFSDDQSNKRFVEITMVYHALRGLSIMRSRGEEPPINMGMMPEYRSKISICNYRFVREFTKGVDDEWTVNLLNHFKPADLIDNN